MFDLRRRLRVRTAKGIRRHQRWSGKAGSTLERLAIKWALKVSIAFSAGFVRWSYGGGDLMLDVFVFEEGAE